MDGWNVGNEPIRVINQLLYFKTGFVTQIELNDRYWPKQREESMPSVDQSKRVWGSQFWKQYHQECGREACLGRDRLPPQESRCALGSWRAGENTFSKPFLLRDPDKLCFNLINTFRKLSHEECDYLIVLFKEYEAGYQSGVRTPRFISGYCLGGFWYQSG